MEEISLSSIELPAAKNTATREREDNIVETEEELGIFQLLDRLEEVTSMLTTRWQESMRIFGVITAFLLFVLYNISLNMYLLKYLLL